MLHSHVKSLVDRWVELVVEIFYLIVPWELPFGNAVELLLNLCGEIIVEYIGEEISQETVDHFAYIGRNEFTLFRTDGFGFLL